MKVTTVIGARPQFIKAGPVSTALADAGVTQILVHTGQHYDPQMSDVFFTELGLPKPDYNLAVGSSTHGAQTGLMLQKIEEVLLADRPDWLLTYGDTNSTLAGALAAAKLDIPVAHVEAGLRSFNRKMPEEINRVMTDHVSALLFCPTQASVDNLRHEGITAGVHRVGDVMYDAILKYSNAVPQVNALSKNSGLLPGRFVLATIHRPANTDSPDRLEAIVRALAQVDQPVLWPVHPRTRSRLRTYGLWGLVEGASNLKLAEPLSYLTMLWAERNAAAIVTDSGGVQKEAHMFMVPCITLRDETEWVETLDGGWNRLLGSDPEGIATALAHARPTRPVDTGSIYGDGQASRRIVELLLAQ